MGNQAPILTPTGNLWAGPLGNRVLQRKLVKMGSCWNTVGLMHSLVSL